MNNFVIFFFSLFFLVYSYFTSQLQSRLVKQALQKTTLKHPVFIPNPIYRNLLLFFTTIYLVAFFFLPHSITGFNALTIGFILIAQLKDLHHWELLSRYPLQLYYIVQFAFAITYVYLGILCIMPSLSQ
ncbi:hypothetical protein QV06_09800 [Gallibacterium genomosp. 3]|uniref:Uncharacterized protein n=1 Tax=Gallibacterium genomosp. 3 TaxID=505345 RepID=A0A1A7PN81_9PAST|nr:hypothetical protein [Gallibacterium genomosp. 3]OBX03534.1 hypothetical protein QV06_09800 [Gallibacterium genomosp. 3]